MFFGPNRPMPMPRAQSPFSFGGQPPYMQQPNMFNMSQFPTMQNMSNMPNPMMMRNPSPFMAPGGSANFGNSNGGGGLLAKLFGRSGARSIGNMGGIGQIANTGGGIGQLANTGALQQLANPSNLTGMLTNVQKALKMAESVMPMVQQYGPLVRNVPAMIKLYSELKNVDTDDEEESSTTTSEASTVDSLESDNEKVEVKSSPAKNTKTKIKRAAKPISKGNSAPKLYI